jgi:AIPR protein
MKINNQAIDQAYSDLKATCKGNRNDYFGLVYLENEFRIPREEAVNLIAFGGNDYGVDGFYFDQERRNFYLLQFKYSESYASFKESFQRLIDSGMEQIFGARSQDVHKNDLLEQIHSSLLENQAVIDKVYIHFVFMGDPADAERSAVLDKLSEDLENKRHLLDKFFNRQVTLLIEYRSGRGRKTSGVSHQRTSRTYPIELAERLGSVGPDGQQMLIGFVRLVDLHGMYREMGQRFFERNIRSALPEEGAVNRALERAFRQIVVDGKDGLSAFVFDHNGVTLAAEKVEQLETSCRVTEPRLLNGAQTITTLARFIEKYADHPSFKENRARLEEVRVICKIISGAEEDFIIRVTVNNNRQNPVEPWNLRANDRIQLELQDKFRDDLEIYYSRQEEAFENLSTEELEEKGISAGKPIELLKLTQTFLVADGDIDKTAWMRRVFEDDRNYEQVFNRNRLKADSRKILLCYKVQFKLRRLMDDILDKGPSKYGYLNRARPLLWALVCQGILNDKELERYAEDYGTDMTMPVDFTEYLSWLATARCRQLFSDLTSSKENVSKIAEGKFSFLRTNASYKQCMALAYRRWQWVQKGFK